MSQRSFLKWAGNKYNCLKYLLPEFPESNRLIEPFAGSATIFLNTNFKENILAEANTDLINLFATIKNDGEDFVKYCETFFTDKNNQSHVYYDMRDKFNNTSDIKERSALFIYLNKHGYNGLCRYNSQGKFNVPFGSYSKPYFPHKELLNFIEKSQNALFVNADFKQTFKLAKPGDFIYCDPPYSPIIQESNFSAYTQNRFNQESHLLLANMAKKTSKQGVSIIISNHDTEFTRQAYSGATIKSFNVRRLISRNANARMMAKELIAIFTSN